jgi:O-antigen ligase
MNYIRPKKDFDFRWFIAYSLMSIGFIIACQMTAYHLNDLSTWHLGWGNINIGSIMFLIAVPATAYLLCKAKVLLPFLAMILFMFLGALFSDGEGVLAILAIFAPLIIFMVYKNMRLEKRKTFKIYIYIIVFAIIALAGLIIASGKLPALIDKLYVTLTNDNSRTPLYKEAWRLFLENPVFGIGVGYYNDAQYEPEGGIIMILNFHCTPLHVMATMGLLGVIMYACYFIVRFRILTQNYSIFNIMMFFAFGLFEIYGCVDPCEFIVMPDMIIATLVIVATEIMNDFETHCYPLLNNPKNAVLKAIPYKAIHKQNKFLKLIYSL